MIKDDNIRVIQKLIQQQPFFQQYQHDFPSKLVEDVKVRCLFTMQVEQKKQYFGLASADLNDKEE